MKVYVKGAPAGNCPPRTRLPPDGPLAVKVMRSARAQDEPNTTSATANSLPASVVLTFAQWQVNAPKVREAKDLEFTSPPYFPFSHFKTKKRHFCELAEVCAIHFHT